MTFEIITSKRAVGGFATVQDARTYAKQEGLSPYAIQTAGPCSGCPNQVPQKSCPEFRTCARLVK